MNKFLRFLYLCTGLRNAAGGRQPLQSDPETVVEVGSRQFRRGQHNASANGSTSGHGLMHSFTHNTSVRTHLERTANISVSLTEKSLSPARMGIQLAMNSTGNASGMGSGYSLNMSVSSSSESKDVFFDGGQHEWIEQHNSAASLFESGEDTMRVLQDSDQTREQYEKVSEQFKAAHLHAWQAAKDVAKMLWQLARHCVTKEAGGEGQDDEILFQPSGTMLDNSSSLISFELAIAGKSARQKLVSWSAPTLTITIPWSAAVLLGTMVSCMACCCTIFTVRGFMRRRAIKIPDSFGYELDANDALLYDEKLGPPSRFGSEAVRMLAHRALNASKSNKIPPGQMLLDTYDEHVKAQGISGGSSHEDKVFSACPHPAEWARVVRLNKLPKESRRPAWRSRSSSPSSQASTDSPPLEEYLSPAHDADILDL